MNLIKITLLSCSIYSSFSQNFKGFNAGLNVGGCMISNVHKFIKQTGDDEPGSASEKSFAMALSGFVGYNYVTSGRKIIGIDLHIGKIFGQNKNKMRDKKNTLLYEYSTKPSMHFGGCIVLGMLLNQSSVLYLKAGYGTYKISLDYLKSQFSTNVPNQSLNLSFKTPIIGAGLIYRFGQKSFVGVEYNFFYASAQKNQEQSATLYELTYNPSMHHLYFKMGCFF